MLIFLLHFQNLLLKKLALLFKNFTFQCDSRQNNFICREHTLEVLFVSSSVLLTYTKCELVCWPLPEFKHMQKRGGGGVGGRGRKRK
jgi:hypothetical protein